MPHHRLMRINFAQRKFRFSDLPYCCQDQSCPSPLLWSDIKKTSGLAVVGANICFIERGTISDDKYFSIGGYQIEAEIAQHMTAAFCGCAEWTSRFDHRWRQKHGMDGEQLADSPLGRVVKQHQGRSASLSNATQHRSVCAVGHRGGLQPTAALQFVGQAALRTHKIPRCSVGGCLIQFVGRAIEAVGRAGKPCFADDARLLRLAEKVVCRSGIAREIHRS